MNLEIQSRATGKSLSIRIDFRGCRRDVIDYVARIYPGHLITRFAD